MEKTEKIVNAETEKAGPYSLKELKEKALRLRKKLSRDVIFLNPQEEREREEKEQITTREFLENLLKEKERFKYVFETEKGSVYFVLPTGQSWRFKKASHGYKEHSILTKIFFIDSETFEYLFSKGQLGIGAFEKQFINQKIKTVKLAEGVFPVEFGLSDYPEIIFEEDEDCVKIIGVKVKTREGEEIIPHFMASGWHFGHVVAKIIKS